MIAWSRLVTKGSSHRTVTINAGGLQKVGITAPVTHRLETFPGAIEPVLTGTHSGNLPRNMTWASREGVLVLLVSAKVQASKVMKKFPTLSAIIINVRS